MEREDLHYFREMLRQMIDDIQEKGQSTLEDMSGSSQAYADPADRASQESDQFFTLRLRDRDRKLVSKIKEAVERIEEGTYGVCLGSGEAIPPARLEARPWAKYTIDYARLVEKGLARPVEESDFDGDGDAETEDDED